MKKLLLIFVLFPSFAFGQGAGAFRTQEIYSSTGKIRMEQAIVPTTAVVTYSATPTFDAATAQSFKITMTGNVTSSTLSNAGTGQFLFFTVCQDGTGSHTFVWPTSFQNAPTVVPDASKCTNINGFYDGTNFNIAGQWNTATGGTGSGTVTSVGVQGDGIVENTSLAGSPVTTNGTMTMSLVPANASYVLAGPVGAAGSNVGVRQAVICSSIAVSTFNCPAFSSPVVSGNKILVMLPCRDTPAGTFSDTLGTTITAATTSGSGTLARYGFGTLGSAGSDTVTITSACRYGTTSTPSDLFGAIAMELTGTLGVNAGQSAQVTSGSFISSTSRAVAAGAVTDAFIRWGFQTSNRSTPDAGSTTMSPVGSGVEDLTNLTMSNVFGKVDILGPQTTASVTNTATWIQTAGSGAGSDWSYMIVMDMTQDPAGGSATPAYRRLLSSDLPSSAVTAIQSVNRFNLGSNFTVTAGSDNTVFSQAITMPSDGCPCRVLAQYGLFLKATSAAAPWDVWMSDGTTVFNGWEMHTVNATEPSANSSASSPNAYANNQSVTFTVHVQTDAGATGTVVNQNAAAGGGKTFMVLTVIPSRN